MSQQPPILVPRDLLEYCQELQVTIDYSDTPEAQDAAGRLASEALRKYPTDFHGTRDVALRALEAWTYPDKLTQESSIWPVIRYPQMWLSGEIGRVVYMRVNQLRTLAWMMVNVSVLSAEESQIPPSSEVASVVVQEQDSPTEIPLPLETRLIRPLYLPVGVIETVFPLS